MQNRILSQLLIIVAVVLPSLTFGQTNTVNTFSPYSLYGLGELQSPGTIQTRSMGGAGVAMRSSTSINLLNPASYSVALRRGVLFDLAMEASTYTSSQKVDGVGTYDTYTSANFRDVAFQFPIASGIGAGFSLTPYSSVGYFQENPVITDSYDYANYVNEGSGDVTEVKLGVGWEIVRGLSIGAAITYYWGDLDRSFYNVTTNIVTPGSAVSTWGNDNVSVSKIMGQLGAQWIAKSSDRRALILGATYDIGGDLNPIYIRTVTAVSEQVNSAYTQADTTRMSIIMPSKLSAGATYNDDKFTIALDYSYQRWGSENESVEYSASGFDVTYRNVSQVRFGVEYTPRRVDVRKYMNRVNYRFGANYGGYQYAIAGEDLRQYAVTLGAGFPYNSLGISRLNVGLEWGSLGTNKVVTVSGESIGLVKQNHIKVTLGVTMFGDDYWFQRQQID